LIATITPYLEQLRHEIRLWFSDDLFRQVQKLVDE